MPRQTVQTKIRLLVQKEQSDLGLHCLTLSQFIDQKLTLVCYKFLYSNYIAILH